MTEVVGDSFACRPRLKRTLGSLLTGVATIAAGLFLALGAPDPDMPEWPRFIVGLGFMGVAFGVAVTIGYGWRLVRGRRPRIVMDAVGITLRRRVVRGAIPWSDVASVTTFTRSYGNGPKNVWLRLTILNAQGYLRRPQSSSRLRRSLRSAGWAGFGFGRYPDRLDVLLSDLDRSPADILAAIEHFGGPAASVEAAQTLAAH